MSAADLLAALRPYVRNALPTLAVPWAAGVLGDHPSQYSRSPVMWNAAFAALELPAAYVAFDVAAEDLDGFMAACRTAPGLLGLSVTVPFKERVQSYLDVVDADAALIGAVNTVARTPDGRLWGANTDGRAVVEALHRLNPAGFPGSSRNVLVLGAGGAARALGVAVAGAMAGTTLSLCNRSADHAEAMAQTVRRAGGVARAVAPADLDELLPEADLLINATSVGMAGAIPRAGGVVWLEPFSPLAPADPAPLPTTAAGVTTPPAEWWTAAWPAIARNLEVSLRRALRLRLQARVLDVIYAPPETVLLKHARWTGHQTANGLAVLVGQAVEAFLRICQPLLLQGAEAVRAKVTQAMTEALR